ncbi:ApcC hetero-tetramer Cut9-Hcn1 [Gigaspora margarita]|uniref:ApcC hetero-tetramer Cut9-Hcn1 n=1 Tax=Gigaspora margarita TaxID=4874 RepID=A0A8H4EJE3_GIGMA|nr:ApcC hetero-tetramer Cut9-Hcn1 [Gigaspora margarita]
MMTSKEEWGFVHSLKFDEQLEYEEAYFYQNELHINAEEECLEITTKLLELDMYNQACFPIHIVCLTNCMRKTNYSCLLTNFVEHSPDKAIMWFSVGCYNFLIGQNSEARRYFTEASTMDSHCRPEWVGFGHNLAIESEHDQAITNYSTITKLYPGYAQSVDSFKNALKVAEETNCQPQVWETIWINLGHAFRQLGELDIAKSYFQKVVSMSPPNSNALPVLEYIYHVKKEFEEAIIYYHVLS